MIRIVNLYIALAWLLVTIVAVVVVIIAALLLPLAILLVWLWCKFIRKERFSATHVPAASHR